MHYLFVGFIAMMLVVFAGKIIAGPKLAGGYDRAVLSTFRWVFIGSLVACSGCIAYLMLAP